jgi:hypothetical protein
MTPERWKMAQQKPKLDGFPAAASLRIEYLPIVGEALTHLARMDARQAPLAEPSFRGGVTEEEAVEGLGGPVRTAEHNWRSTRARLYLQFKAPLP